MDIFSQILDQANNILWTYVLVAMLISCAIWFTLRCKGVQLTMLRDIPTLFRNCTHKGQEENAEHISSFQAFAISIASRVGTGNLAGVAVAIAMGGPVRCSGCGSLRFWEPAVLLWNPRLPSCLK